MTQPDIAQLERDVEMARARLASDLSTLRDPATMSTFTRDLKAEANDTVETWSASAKSGAQSAIQGIIDDIKGRAAANPAATLAIGAGLAWRLIHHPPIATALIGAGIYGLLRTNPVRANGGQQVDYLSYARERAKQQAGEAASYVQGLAEDAAESAREQAVELAGVAQEKMQQWSETAQGKMQHWSEEAKTTLEDARSEFRSRAAELEHQAGSAACHVGDVIEDGFDRSRRKVVETARAGQDSLQSTLADHDVRNTLMLGLAGMAVAAALGIAYQRRAAELVEDHPHH
jgi:hypothetical protein